uniref:protein-tyrosine-phosphatase n=1 Tax=Seriola dumerili TaxID=41447 RepID=A0A3B4UY45_SERDU
MVLLEPERHTLTIYPSEILEGALYQGSASQASDYRIIKNLHITHVVNATANCPDAFPNMLCYLQLRLSDDAQQDLVEALPLASRFINTALKAEPAGRVLVHCSMGRSRSSALTLAFLMEHQRWSLLHALRWLKERRACTAPNVNFLRQLLTYEDNHRLIFGFVWWVGGCTSKNIKKIPKFLLRLCLIFCFTFCLIWMYILISSSVFPKWSVQPNH